MMRIAHIVPALGIGGVEVAIERSLRDLRARFDYRVFTVRRRGTLDCGQQNVFRLLWDVLRGRWRPEVVITSLWYAHPFGFVLHLFGIPWLTFFHSSQYAHAVEKWLVRWAWRSSAGRLVDSRATADFLASTARRPSHVVPYVFAAETATEAGSRDIDLVWVGRNSPEKRLDLVRDFVLALAARLPGCRAALIVAGARAQVLDALMADGRCHVEIFQSIESAEVRRILRRSRFYLLVSDYEGMSMSTIEAVQAGCVPVVRPVGEIVRYLDASSAILIHDISAAGIARVVEAVAALRQDDTRALECSRRARANLESIPRYVDSLAGAIQSVHGRRAS